MTPHADMFVSLVAPTVPIEGSCFWFLFRKGRLLVRGEGDGFAVPQLASPADLGLTVARPQYLGLLEGRHCLAGELDGDGAPPAGTSLESLRRLFDSLPGAAFRVAVRAVQIVAWDRDNQYCGRCREPLEQRPGERAKVCPSCGLTRYPRISPAIIVAVSRDEQLLLARAHRHPSGFYSVLAGFVEPGETLEEAVQREVREEVGIEVSDIHYFGSQPWPFPDSLMLAFTARYAGGEIRLEESEIAEAGWYSAAEIPPTIPPAISIARALIDDFVGGRQR